ncbi:MAG: PD-(D/E)XK nuclease family transposase [Clostridia bacterium]|nr:PD-(D/E)XK nuclease family transposase [Clostridia bacterium]
MTNTNEVTMDMLQNMPDYDAILEGKIIPPLYLDIIAKRIFNPDVHPDRLNFLLRGITKDASIDVASSASNENFKQTLKAKSMITDIAAWLKDKRLAVTEMQFLKQDHIFSRGELYSSSLLLLQYAVAEDQPKSELNYTNAKDVLLIVLMVKSPAAFLAFNQQSNHYIHRFTDWVSDTGMRFPMKSNIIYVQLDKCLEQFKAGKNAEAEDGKPDELQLWLSMIADINDKNVNSATRTAKELQRIKVEALNMAQDKEVQTVLMQEKMERMDWASFGLEQKRTGEAIGEERGEKRGIAIGEERGEKRGIAIGGAKGLEKFAKLILKLQSLGRDDDAQKALSDANYRTNLLKGFGML